MSIIDKFDGEYRFLSNFYIAPIDVDGLTFPSVEHAFQAMKTFKQILRVPFTVKTISPGQAKRMGRKLELRSDWEDIKIDVMKSLVYKKFCHHPDVRSKLLDTGDTILIEGNNWGDKFWGVCDNVGENHLGKILMEVRSHLKQLELIIDKRLPKPGISPFITF